MRALGTPEAGEEVRRTECLFGSPYFQLMTALAGGNPTVSLGKSAKDRPPTRIKLLRQNLHLPWYLPGGFLTGAQEEGLGPGSSRSPATPSLLGCPKDSFPLPWALGLPSSFPKGGE